MSHRTGAKVITTTGEELTFRRWGNVGTPTSKIIAELIRDGTCDHGSHPEIVVAHTQSWLWADSDLGKELLSTREAMEGYKALVDADPSDATATDLFRAASSKLSMIRTKAWMNRRDRHKE